MYSARFYELQRLGSSSFNAWQLYDLAEYNGSADKIESKLLLEKAREATQEYIDLLRKG
tara:strand:- start:209 stop:385 length:177 start_codon:yes stop_codon:yes gene_type:complete